MPLMTFFFNLAFLLKDSKQNGNSFQYFIAPPMLTVIFSQFKCIPQQSVIFIFSGRSKIQYA